MSPSLCNPKLGDDYPPGFKIWIHEIYPDIHVTTTKMQMDHFLESSPVFHDDMVARLNQNRQRQQELELESQEEGQNTRASREQIEALIREESMLIRRERLAAENSNSSNTRPCANPGSLKWFHIPANHMRWVDSFFAAYNGGAYRLDEELWTHMLRPELSGNRRPPVHATHMLPAFLPARPVENSDIHPLFTLYLPYMNWETCNDYCSLYEMYTGHEWPLELEGRKNGRDADPNLFSVQRDMKSLHPRRTLDQFMYPFLTDTTDRDTDQTVSKWTSAMSNYEEEGRADATSRLIMVDQLWCWVIDDATVLTCFPSHNTQYRDQEFHDLYNCISEELIHCESAQGLCALIGRQAATHLITPRNQRFLDPIGIYQQAASKKTTDQITLFQKFQQSLAEGTPSFNDHQDFALLRDVADMNDELKMIQGLIGKQRGVVEDMDSALGRRLRREPKKEQEFEVAERFLYSALDIVRRMIDEADRTHFLILQLLDLKQKSATLSEARSTAQQGRAVMLFTTVTVIFLPLSFFTSYYGQNVSEITGDGSNPSTWDLWKVGMPISLVVILLALCIAFLITRSQSPLERLRIWRARRATRQRLRPISTPRAQVNLPNRLDQTLRTSTPDPESIINGRRD